MCAGVSGAVRLPLMADTPEMDSRVIPVVDSVKWEDETPMTKVSGEVAFVRVVSLSPMVTIRIAPFRYARASVAGLEKSVVHVL